MTTDSTAPLRRRAIPPQHAATPPSLILLVGGGDQLARDLAARTGNRVRAVPTADETDGVGVGVIVVTGPYPLSTLADVRVHPRLHHLPVVLLAPGRRYERRGCAAVGVQPVLETDRPAERTAEAIRRASTRVNTPLSLEQTGPTRPDPERRKQTPQRAGGDHRRTPLVRTR